jgi:hypothetical protein
MIEEYFRSRQALARVLSTFVGAYLDDLATELSYQGFGRWKLCGRIVGAAHFSLWSQKGGVSVDRLHEDGLGRFQRHLGGCRCPRPFQHSRHGDVCAVSGARALVEHLRHKSVVSSPPPSLPIQEQPPLVSAFNEWTRQHRGLVPSTLRGYNHVIRETIETLGAILAGTPFRASCLRHEASYAGKQESWEGNRDCDARLFAVLGCAGFVPHRNG